MEQIRLQPEVAEIEKEIIAWRRYFHQNPEVSMKEYNTSATIKKLLDKWGVSYVNVGETGILATLNGTKGEGKTILLRADMDALPLIDETQTCYTSQKEGINHACGHDGHTAALLGATKILKDKEFKGKIKIIFQPAEEIGRGAKLFLKAGHLEDVNRVFGIHLHSPTEVGKVIATIGARGASCDIFEIRVKGESAHVSKPHQGKDALLATAHIAVALQSIVSRRINPLQPAVVGLGTMQAGTEYNIVAKEGVLKGTVRAFDKEVRKQILKEIEEIAKCTAKIYQTEAEFSNFAASVALVNDEAPTLLAQKVLKDIVGEENILKQEVGSLGGEDFADLMEVVTGTFLHVGSRNPENPETWYPHHHVKFDIDERCLAIATQTHISYALAYLNEE